MARGATASTSFGVMIGLALAAFGVIDAFWSVVLTAVSAALVGMGLGALGHTLVEDATGSAPATSWAAAEGADDREEDRWTPSRS